MAEHKYELVKELGKGGMGVVWLARNRHTQELVALKIMTGVPEDDKRDQKERERFEREIQFALSLNHPHVLRAIDYGFIYQDGRRLPYLVSPYMSDGPLQDLVNKKIPWKQWTLTQTADAIVQAAEGLAYLHTRTPRVVHQDVKPANFLLRLEQKRERAAHLYLCDFGISRQQMATFVLASEALGTYEYIAPEQIEKRISWASDQYSLAVMSCLLLTGKLPLQVSTREEYLRAHREDPPIPPSVLNPERITSTEIDAIILRAMEKVPERRYPSILEFARTLEQAILEQVRTGASASTEKLSQPTSPLPQEAAASPIQFLPFEPAPPLDVKFSPIPIDPVTPDKMQVLDEPLQPKNPLAVPVSPPRLKPGALPLLPLREYVRHELPARPKMLYWSPDGNWLACTFYEHTSLLIERDGRGVEALPISEAVQGLSWSPDSNVLVVALQNEIFFWDRTTQQLWPMTLHARTIEGLDWSSRGQLAVWADSQVFLYTLSQNSASPGQFPSNQTLLISNMRPGGIGTLRWSPDGSWLAAGAINGALVCWRASTQRLQWQTQASGKRVHSLCWSPDSSWFATASSDKRVVSWNVETGQKREQWERLSVMPRMLSISVKRCVTVASSEHYLLVGHVEEAAPSAMLPGQLLVAWSPKRVELATLDGQEERVLVVWRE